MERWRLERERCVVISSSFNKTQFPRGESEREREKAELVW